MINEEDCVMESLKFSDYKSFANYLYSLAEAGKAVAVTAFGKQISILAKALLANHDITLDYVNNFDNSDYTDYDSEYYLAIDTDLGLSIERVFDDDGRLIKSGLDVGCYLSDVHSKIALNNEDDVQYEIEIQNDCCSVCGGTIDIDDDDIDEEDYDDYDYEEGDVITLTEEDTPMMLYMICEMLDELLDEIKK